MISAVYVGIEEELKTPLFLSSSRPDGHVQKKVPEGFGREFE